MPKRRFEIKGGKSKRFWEIETKGASHTVTYGRLGTAGQSKTKQFDSKQEATAAAEKLIDQKVHKGYQEIHSANAGSKTSRRPKKRTNTKGKATVENSSNAFWKKLPKRQRESRPVVTSRLVKSCEKKLGIRFPASLIELLRVQNGGYLNNPEFIVGGKTWNLSSIPPISQTRGIEPLASGYPDHLDLAEGNLSRPDLIFPLDGDGHWFIALDYRRSGPLNEPAVIYLDIEGKVYTEKIAKTFEEFLKGHQTVDDADPYDEASLAEFIEELSNAMEKLRQLVEAESKKQGMSKKKVSKKVSRHSKKKRRE